MLLQLRVFAPAATAREAEAVAARLVAELADFRVTVTGPPERYWKIPAWYEHTLRLVPADAAGFERVLALAALGWSHVVRDTECDAVWNAGPGACFLLPEVTWAEVQLIHEG